MKTKVNFISNGYHTVTPFLTVKGAAELLEFVKQAFGATVVEKLDSPDGSLAHASVKIGDSRVMLGEVMGDCPPMTAANYLYVKDADVTYRRALKAGATSVTKPANQFWGDRQGGVKDQCGNLWWIATHIENVSPAEMKKRILAFMTPQAVVITRLFNAPRERVFKAWTDPKLMQQWWGPKGFTAPVCKINLRPGGLWHYCMRSPEGQNFWGRGIYREIVKPSLIVATDSFSDAKGHIVPASRYGMSKNWPREMLVKVTFEDLRGKTKLTLTHSGVDNVPATDRRSMKQGWSQSFDKLADLLAKA